MLNAWPSASAKLRSRVPVTMPGKVHRCAGTACRRGRCRDTTLRARTSGSRWLPRYATSVFAFSRSLAGAREIGAAAQRLCDRGVRVGQRRRVGRRVDRIERVAPERRVGRIHDQPAQTIFGVSRRRARLNQVLAALRDFGLRLDEIERRDLAGIHADPVLARELLRELERPLLHADVGDRRLQRPVRLLDGRDRLDDAIRETAARSCRDCVWPRCTAAATHRSRGPAGAAARTRTGCPTAGSDRSC